MDVGCNCFGVATAAKVPVKRYNLLVSALFPVVEPSPRQALGVAVLKNVKRLAEYLEKNEHRIPKVSRRLARRLHQDLSRNHMGYVRVAVEAYTYLIEYKEGKFSGMYAKELIERYPLKKRHFYSLERVSRMARLPPSSIHVGSVVGAMLSNGDELPQRWGADLFVKFVKLQKTSQFMTQLQLLLPMICSKAAAPRSHAGVVESSLAGAGLHGILEYLRYCARIAFAPVLLKDIICTVLSIAEREISLDGVPEEVLEWQQEHVHEDVKSELLGPRPSIGTRVATSSSIALSSLLVLEEMARIASDPVQGRRIVEILLNFLDSDPRRWCGGAALHASLLVLRQGYKEPYKRYLLVSMFLTHSGEAHGLKAIHRITIMREALKDAALLESRARGTSLLVALRELPGAVIAGEYRVGDLIANLQECVNFCDATNLTQNEKSDTLSDVSSSAPRAKNLLLQEIQSTIGQLASSIQGRKQLESVIGAALSYIVANREVVGEKRTVVTLECVLLAAEAYQNLMEKGEVFEDAVEVIKDNQEMKNLEANDMGVNHMSDVLLRCVLTLCLEGTPTERVLSHFILKRVLSAAAPGSYSIQPLLFLSTIYYELNGESLFAMELAAIDSTFGTALCAFTDAKVYWEACKFVLAIEAEIIDSSNPSHGRWRSCTAKHKMAVLTLCQSMWMWLSKALKWKNIQELQPKGLPVSNMQLTEDGIKFPGVPISWFDSHYASASMEAHLGLEEEIHVDSPLELSRVHILPVHESFRVLASAPYFRKSNRIKTQVNGEASYDAFRPLAIWRLGLLRSCLGTSSRQEYAKRFVKAYRGIPRLYMDVKDSSLRDLNGLEEGGIPDPQTNGGHDRQMIDKRTSTSSGDWTHPEDAQQSHAWNEILEQLIQSLN